MFWFTSDLHLGHDKQFIWGPRGFNSIQEMNETIVNRWNTVVDVYDTVYVLGDLMLGDNKIGVNYLNQLNGMLCVIRGNHDTNTRIDLYERDCANIIEVCDARYLKHGKYHFYITHYPCLTGNLEKESLTQMTLNLHGHTHSQKKFFYDLPYCYNVGMDAHNCTPINIEEIIEDMKNKVEECKNFL